MEELFGSQHKNKNMQMRHARCVAIINYFDRKAYKVNANLTGCL